MHLACAASLHGRFSPHHHRHDRSTPYLGHTIGTAPLLTPLTHAPQDDDELHLQLPLEGVETTEELLKEAFECVPPHECNHGECHVVPMPTPDVLCVGREAVLCVTAASVE